MTNFLTPCNQIIKSQAKQILRIFRIAVTLPAFVVGIKIGLRYLLYLDCLLFVTRERERDECRTNLISVGEGELKWLSSPFCADTCNDGPALYCRISTCRKTIFFTVISFTPAKSLFLLHSFDIRGRRFLRNVIELEASSFILNTVHFIVSITAYSG